MNQVLIQSIISIIRNFFSLFLLYFQSLLASNMFPYTSQISENELRADVSKYRPEVYKSEKSTILKKIHKVALGKLLT